MLQVKQQILAGFKSCGYKNNLLKESYQYFDGANDRTAEIVGFYQSIYNSSTACVAAIDKTKLHEKKLETELSPYQLLGCPVLLVYDDSGLQFWKNSGIRVALLEQIESKKLSGFFSKYKDEFSPERIHRAKTFGRVKKNFQLSFCDLGLMPIIEEKEGKYLSTLTEEIINSLKTSCKGIREGTNFAKWIFQAAFWLVGAKILKDKQVERFKNLKISNVTDLVERVQRHYRSTEPLDISNTLKKAAFEKEAKRVENISSFSHLTTESLAYVYENALVSKNTRKVWATHATPSWLVNYIVWGELIDWIENIPQEQRVVLEPACGHAPFLTAAAKLLADPLLYKGDEKSRHDYLKRHLIGIDMDSFAEEIARLALTLADIPNPNGWNIQDSDIYKDDILKKAAQKATILFCNPPFENFTPKEKQIYGNAITTGNKAAEVLAKTLPHLPPNSVFGIILPQGFLYRKNLAELRRYILDNFELRTICNLPDNVFAKAGHLSTVLLGRKTKSKKKINYLNITKANLENFKNTYQAADEELVNKDIFYEAESCDLRIPELKEIWDYCREYPKFQEYAVIGRGIEYKDFDKSVRKENFPGAVKGYASFEAFTSGEKPKKIDINITKLPDYYWMSLNATEIRNTRYGAQCGISQIIASYIRSSRSVWRIEGLMDLAGDPVSNKLISIRPIPSKNISVYIIWALVNSPFTNAYMYCHCIRQNLEGVLRDMPIPFDNQDLSKLESMVKAYFTLSEQQINFTLRDESKLNEKKKQCLLAIDAEVLRLYDLPPRLEKTLLDFFEGVPRKGVDFEFDRYYEEGFDSYIPLHMYISTEFQNSSVENVKKWIESNRIPEVIEAFKTAAKIKK
ncbi:MAG: N-6 DNA methylase [Candidatus Woesebacteria bacterium]|nr:N-6 DNA methylase [Candidatus Woesebacteria bacterium]